MSRNGQPPDLLDDMIASGHVCSLYDSDDTLHATVSAYVLGGLAQKQRICYVVADDSVGLATEILRNAGVEVAQAVEAGQLEIRTHAETYFADGDFDPRRMISYWQSATERSLQAGWTALRLLSDMSWSLIAPDHLGPAFEYEARINELPPETPLLMLCLYDRRRIPAKVLLDMLRTHPQIAVGRHLYSNPDYAPPEMLLGDDAASEAVDQWLGNLLKHQVLLQSAQQSESSYRQLFGSLISGFALHQMIYDDERSPCDYRFVEVNTAFEELTGLNDVVDRRVREVIPELEQSWIDRYADVVKTGEPMRFTMEATALERHYEVVAYRPKAGHFAVLFNDVSDRVKAENERKQLEAKMYESQKLESLGLLAGGIAHDFNNLLVGILGNASLALSELSPLSTAADCLRDVELASKRAAELAKQLLAYSGRGRFVVEPIDLAELVEEMGSLLEASISPNVILRYQLVKRPATVMADASQLRQVIMNLIVNAAESVGKRSGVVTIATDSMVCDPEYLVATFGPEELAPGNYVSLEVSDTGDGMEPDTQRLLFDPFFTTKPLGRGLGLAAVLGIVRGHEGAIKVYSEVGRGSTFKILLPQCDAQVRPASPTPQALTVKQSGTVLVVDDEEPVRKVARRILERMGFDVLTAEDGREGVAIYRTRAADIRFVLLDMMMPRMNGEQAFTELRRIDPDVKVVLSSGYNEQEAVNRFAGRGLAGFVQKPYSARDLEQMVVQILAE